MKIYNSLTDLIGCTPLMRVNNLEHDLCLNAAVLAKIESFNPAGSIKDRVAKQMIESAEREGKLNKNSVIIEPTSGNTGIGLAAVAAARGYKIILTMPDTMSIERRNLLKAYGAQVVLTPGSEGMSGAIKKADELASQMKDSFIPGQFVNQENPEAHRKTTGPEIWNDTDGKVDIFVATAGTGGTLTGTAEYLKQQNPDIKVIAVEPAGSPVLSGGKSGAHGIQGIGAGFIPQILNTSIYDEVIAVSDKDAFDTVKKLVKSEGLLCGISSGAAMFAACLIAEREENKGKNIVVILPDTGDRYLSTPGFVD